jgi:hypothetical protein
VEQAYTFMRIFQLFSLQLRYLVGFDVHLLQMKSVVGWLAKLHQDSRFFSSTS